MNTAMTRPLPKWMFPSLWGLDIAVASFCWSMCIAHLMQITMMPDGPMLLVVVSAWVFTILGRMLGALYRQPVIRRAYYIRHAVPLGLVALASMVSAFWMLFYYVGQHMLAYALIPVLIYLLPFGTGFKGFESARTLSKALAFAFACMVPAMSCSFTMKPLEMLFCAPCWYLGVLFFLFMKERMRWDHAVLSHNGPSGVLLTGLFIVLAACAFSSYQAPYFERCLCMVVAIAGGCLLILARIRPELRDNTVLALSWPVMTFPALLGVLIF